MYALNPCLNAVMKKMEAMTSEERLDPKMCTLPKLFALMGTLLLGVPGHDVAAAREVLNPRLDLKASENNREGMFEYSKMTFEVILPPDLEKDFIETVDFSLESKAAGEIGEKDFYHCHILTTSFEYETRLKSYHGTLSRFVSEIFSLSTGLLCHTQEKQRWNTTNPLEYSKRNVVKLKEANPYVANVVSGPGDFYTLDAQEVINTEKLMSPLTVYFKLSPQGNVSLRNGQKIQTYVAHLEDIMTPDIVDDVSVKK